MINLRNSSQPEDTDTVEVLAFISVSVAHFNSARSPDIVPTVNETQRDRVCVHFDECTCTRVGMVGSSATFTVPDEL